MAIRPTDVSVIGGGVAGIGVAIECAKLGLSVHLFERSRLCSATSGNSLRIIHGGIRYLQNFDFSRTLESIQAQEELIQFAPGLIRRLPCLMPLRAFGLRSRLPAAIAAKMYDAIGSKKGRAKRSRILPARFIKRYHHELSDLTPHGALLWHDAYIADLAGFEQHLSNQLRHLGVIVSQDTEVREVNRTNNGFTLKASSVEETIEAITVINCAGAWLDSVKISGIKIAPRNSNWCRAFNLIVSKQISSRFALGLHSAAGRLLFIVPRGSNSAIGTGYLPYDSKSAQLDSGEIDEFLSDINNTVPQLALRRSDIVATEVGVLPGVPIHGKREPQPRAHPHISSDRGYFELLSTKYTTFLTQAQKIALQVAAAVKNVTISAH